MSDITLKELKKMRDWLPLRQVRVKPEQRKYTTLLVLSYMQSSHPAVTTFAVESDSKTIGYVMLIQADNPAQWIIERLTIDRDYQRQGLGYAVADQLIDMIYEFEKSEMVIARYDTDNTAARDLFEKLKFEEQDKLVRNRNIALLEFEFEEDDNDENDEDITDSNIPSTSDDRDKDDDEIESDTSSVNDEGSDNSKDETSKNQEE